MSDTVDVTSLSGSVLGVERDVRVLRLQFDQFAGTVQARPGGIEARLGVMEQSAHDLSSEVARGFGRIQQQLARQEKRFDTLDAALTLLPDKLLEHIERIVDVAVSTRGK
jgi:hypothetical protein